MTDVSAPPPVKTESSFELIRWFFLRALALVYFSAFASLMPQITGLIGENGILPVKNFLARFDAAGPWETFLSVPSLCWIDAGDGFLKFLCISGAFFSLMLLVNAAPRIFATLLWVFYLSIVAVGQDFLGFQWDSLLLESGFLAMFIAPPGILPRFQSRRACPKTIVWLYLWLLFRLTFFSGVVKIASQDPHWRDFTALSYHYQTQPLPHFLSWYAHQLPSWFHSLSAKIMFVIEIAAPFFLFTPAPTRRIAFFAFGALQALIILTGNFCYFNYLALALGLFALDDAFLGRFLPESILSRFIRNAPAERPSRVGNFTTGAVAILLLLPTVTRALGFYGITPPLPRVLETLSDDVERLRITGHYGLFAIMTTERDEIEVQGSSDGTTWKSYAFPYKPGDLSAVPKWIAPHQPRLDWQMWFASLSDFRHNVWFKNFLVRLLQGKEEVAGLLAENPFPDAPPKYVRAKFYKYEFTDFAERSATGHWWKRSEKADYAPTLSLKIE
jgi:hypothetical protein